MSRNRIHSAVTHVTATGWGWACQDCPAKSDGYQTQNQASRVAAIHEDPSRNTQGSRAAATKN